MQSYKMVDAFVKYNRPHKLFDPLHEGPTGQPFHIKGV